MFFTHRDTGEDGERVRKLLRFRFTSRLFLKNPLVVGGKDLDESREEVIEVFENPLSVIGAGVVSMVFDKPTDNCNLCWIFQRTEFNHLRVDFWREVLVNVENVSNSTGHTSSKVTSCGSQNNDTPSCHVLTPVITDAFDDCGSTRITYCESLGGNASEEALAGGCSVQTHVSNDDVFFGLENGILGRIDDESSTRDTFPDIIVRVAFEFESDTGCEERAERLASRASDAYMDSIG